MRDDSQASGTGLVNRVVKAFDQQAIPPRPGDEHVQRWLQTGSCELSTSSGHQQEDMIDGTDIHPRRKRLMHLLTPLPAIAASVALLVALWPSPQETPTDDPNAPPSEPIEPSEQDDNAPPPVVDAPERQDVKSLIELVDDEDPQIRRTAIVELINEDIASGSDEARAALTRRLALRWSRTEPQEPYRVTKPPQQMRVATDRARILQFDRAIQKFHVHNEKLVSGTPLAPNQIQIAGKAPGTTHIRFWGSDDELYVLDVVVRSAPDPERTFIAVDAGLSAVGPIKSVRRESGDLKPPYRWLASQNANVFQYSVDIEILMAELGRFVDGIAGDRIFDDVLNGLRLDPNGPRVDVRRDIVGHFTGQAIAVVELGDAFLIALPVDNEQDVAGSIRMFSRDPSIETTFQDGVTIYVGSSDAIGELAICVANDCLLVGNLETVRGALQRKNQ